MMATTKCEQQNNHSLCETERSRKEERSPTAERGRKVEHSHTAEQSRKAEQSRTIRWGKAVAYEVDISLLQRR